MKPSIASILLATTVAIVVPPFLLVPMVFGLPNAQVFKDLYEVCLWLTPSVGVVALLVIFRLIRRRAIEARRPAILAAILIASLDLVAPLLFYLLLAIIAGR